MQVTEIILLHLGPKENMVGPHNQTSRGKCPCPLISKTSSQFFPLCPHYLLKKHGTQLPQSALGSKRNNSKEGL
jgi:hypothetical protein